MCLRAWGSLKRFNCGNARYALRCELPRRGLIAAAVYLAMMSRRNGTVNSSLTLRPRARRRRKKLEDWRKYYNEGRPHGAIGQKTPIMLLNHAGAASPPA